MFLYQLFIFKCDYALKISFYVFKYTSHFLYLLYVFILNKYKILKQIYSYYEFYSFIKLFTYRSIDGSKITIRYCFWLLLNE